MISQHSSLVSRAVVSQREGCRILFQPGTCLCGVCIVLYMHAWVFSGYSDFLPLSGLGLRRAEEPNGAGKKVRTTGGTKIYI